MTNSVEIARDELKEYAVSSRDVTFTPAGCKMRSKRGRVEFDFSEFNPSQIYIHLKRSGGNGKITVSGHELIVYSRSYETFDICIGGKVELSRPKDSTGDIVLLGFTFSADKVGVSAVDINWKELIRRCGKYSCLRLVKGRLFASTGGFIERGSIIRTIETNPPNAVVRDGDKIRFSGSCEIVNIVLSHDAPVDRPAELYTNREPPTPIDVPQPETQKNKANQPGGNAALRPQKYQHQLPNFDDHVLYDSSAQRNFNSFIVSRAQGVKQIRSNNTNYLAIRSKGSVKGAISSLKANTSYICILNGKKLSGNGKLFMGASIDDNFAGRASEIVFSSNFTNRYVQFRTSGGAPNSTQKLHLTMPDKLCHGEVLIQRIMVIEDLGIAHAKSAVDGRRYISASDMQRPSNPASSFGFNMDVHRRDDYVYVNAKKYAFYPHIKDAQKLDSKLRGTIMSNNVSGVVWASRVKSVINHIRIGDLESETTNDSLLISHLGHLKSAKMIWIEPFEGEAKISEEDRRAINRAHKVMSPSLYNVQYLQSKFEDKKIVQACRPLPWVKPTTEPMFKDLDFVLTFERDRKKMNQLFKVWEPHFPKLIVVGARGSYPEFVIPLNEYYPYRKLLYLMRKARFIVDLPESCDYHSSLLDLANSMGKTMVSTNWYVVDKPNGIFIEKQDLNDSLKRGIGQAMSAEYKVNNMSDYPKRFLAQVEGLFSL